MDACAASTQGQIGYAIAQNLQNLLHDRPDIQVANLITEVSIDTKDPKSLEPVKPIGPWYDKEEAKKLKETHHDWVIEKRINPKSEEKVFRRIVLSPIPTGFTNIAAMKTLKNNNFTVIASGGGGIPVIYNEENQRKGVAGVIDKDRTAAKLGNQLNTDSLIILTNVPNVAINYNKPNQKNLSKISPVEALVYDYLGHFEKGSMQPKVEAAIDFINGGGNKVIITDGEHLGKAIEGSAGTIIQPDIATKLLLRWKTKFLNKKH
jgi:carbamate kinase